MISKSIALIFRLGQLVCATVIMALDGHILSTSYWYTIPRTAGNAREVNFTMFLSVFTLLSLAFLGPTSWKYFTDQTVFRIASIVDGLNLLFYMCDGIALAAALEVHSCNNPLYTEGNRITQTSPNTKVRCQEAQAMTAFVWFIFILFVFTTVFSLSMSNLGLPFPEVDPERSTGHKRRRTRHSREETEERPRYNMEEVTGGPAIADDPIEPPRSYGRRSGHRRDGSLNGGYWNTDSEENVIHSSRHDASLGRAGGRVVNVPIGGPEFTDEEGGSVR